MIIRSFLTLCLMIATVLTTLPLHASTLVTTPVPTGQPLTAAFTTTASCSDATSLKGIPTYESLGLYLDAGSGEAKVCYRRKVPLS